MEDKQIIDLIRTALDEVAPGRTFPDLAFGTNIEALGLDSIATMEMVGFIEERVDATFPDEELAKVKTVGDLGGLIRGGRVNAA